MALGASWLQPQRCTVSVTLILPTKSVSQLVVYAGGLCIIYNGTPMGAPVTAGLNLLLGFWDIGFDHPVARKLLGGPEGGILDSLL